MEELSNTQDSGAGKASLEGRLSSGANWFYWIAGLSIINSIIWFVGGDWGFIFGLGVTQVIDAIAAEIAGQSGIQTARYVGFALDLMAAGLLALFGFFANRRMLWAFCVGMLLYGLDGLLFILVQDWLGVAFHVFALVCIFAGFQACRQLRRLDRESAVVESEAGTVRVEFR